MSRGGATGGDSRRSATGGFVLRVVSSVVLIVVAGAAAWAGGLAAGLVVALVVGLVQSEWVGITEGRMFPGTLFAVPVAIAMIFASLGEPELATLICLAAAVIGLITGPRAWRAGGVVYAAALGLSLLMLRDSAAGLASIVFVFAVVWATDIGAYFAGRTFGGPKLWPAVSPKKTWSGAIGGLLLAVVAGLCALAFFDIGLSMTLAIIVLALSVVSQVGDLFESWIKRRFGVKDSGRIIPGHGGIMDRVDGLVFASVLAFIISMLNQGAGKPGEGLLAW